MTALQHTVPVLVTHVEVACRGCSAVLLVPSNDAGIALCRGCRKSQQDNDAMNIFSAVRALAVGEAGQFDLLTLEDRRVHLSQLNTCLTYARQQLAKEAGEVLAGPVSQPQAVAYEHYLSTAADEPSFEEREAIYAMEEILDREETVASDWR